MNEKNERNEMRDEDQMSAVAELEYEEEMAHEEHVPAPRSHDTDGSQPAGKEALSKDESEYFFDSSDTDEYRNRWNDIQTGFVDDPHEAVESANSLVAELIDDIARTLNYERRYVEDELSQDGEVTTEDQRQALKRYRSLLDRILSL